jgi:hypothetical protein
VENPRSTEDPRRVEISVIEEVVVEEGDRKGYT